MNEKEEKMKYDNNEVLAQCYNAGGWFSLPVGELWVTTSKWKSPVMTVDNVYGVDMNNLFLKYDDIIEVEFRSPNGSEILYRAY